MLYTKQQVMNVVHGIENMPTKNKKVIICDAFGTIVVFWHQSKTPSGERLYNVGYLREDGSQPPLFQW